MFGRKKAPEMPKTMNGENSAIWGFLMHLNGRIDALYILLFGIFVAVLIQLGLEVFE